MKKTTKKKTGSISSKKIDDTKPGLTKDKLDAIKAGFSKKTEAPVSADKVVDINDISPEKITDEKPVNIMTDVTGVKPKKPVKASKTIKIELENTVEYKNKYYRGVQIVNKKLAEKLLELDKLEPENGGSAGVGIIIEKPTDELLDSEKETLNKQ